MFYSQDRNQLRNFYIQAWQKHLQKQPLEPLEKMIAAVIEQHPEYHRLLENQEQALGKEFLPEMGESNPFLHMGLHLGLQEQLGMNRPQGIVDVYQQLMQALKDVHEVEHRMMDCLVEMMWSAQRNQVAPNEIEYLKCLRRVAKQVKK